MKLWEKLPESAKPSYLYSISAGRISEALAFCKVNRQIINTNISFTLFPYAFSSDQIFYTGIFFKVTPVVQLDLDIKIYW